MPRIAVLSLSVAALLAAGCGKGASSVNASTSITKAQAVAFATAVNLRASDVPALVGPRTTERHELTSGPPLLPRKVEACDGGPVLGSGSVGYPSPLYESNREAFRTVGKAHFTALVSVVYLVGGASAARRLITDVDSAHGRACIKRYLASEKSRSISSSQSPGGQPVIEPTFSHVDVRTLPSPLAGDPIYGVRATLATPALPIFGGPPHYQSRDIFAFVAGPILVMLKVNGEPRPFPAQEERRLLSLLYNRAEAHKPT